jgi:hypothetical protein
MYQTVLSLLILLPLRNNKMIGIIKHAPEESSTSLILKVNASGRPFYAGKQ